MHSTRETMLLLGLTLASLLRHPPLPDRRAALVGAAGAVLLPRRACARAPGSEDVDEALAQIRDAAVALKALRRDWASYALIDAEGRAGDVNPARRILGGVAPQRGQEAFDVAIATPLYRCDKAFDAVRKAALNADSGSWLTSFDIEDFVERSETVARSLKKADDAFYSVTFASKGSGQLTAIYDDAKAGVDLALREFDAVLGLLERAGAPGVS